MNDCALKAKTLKETLTANGFRVKVRKNGLRPRVNEPTHYVLVFKPGDPDEARKVAEANGWRYVYGICDSDYTALGMEAPRNADLDADRDPWDDPLPGEMTEYDYLDHTGY